MLVYFLSEHVAWLGGKGVLKLEPARVAQHSMRSVRAMLGNLLIGFLILYQERSAIIAKEQAALTTTDAAERQKTLGKIKDEKAGWTMRFINNSCLAPIFVSQTALYPVFALNRRAFLQFHMSRPDLGLLSDVQIGLLGFTSAFIQLQSMFASA